MLLVLALHFFTFSLTYSCFSIPVFWGSEKKKKTASHRQRVSGQSERKRSGEREWWFMDPRRVQSSCWTWHSVNHLWDESNCTHQREKEWEKGKEEMDNSWTDQWGGERWQVCIQKLVKLRSHAFQHPGLYIVMDRWKTGIFLRVNWGSQFFVLLKCIHSHLF